MRSAFRCLLLAGLIALAAAPSAFAQQCPATVPVQGAAPPPPLPVFPADNWWNLDIHSAPVDTASASYISFINNGGTRHLHPDFGGEESPGSVAVYGFPYAIVDGSQTKLAVTFDTWDESDGVNMSNGQGLPFYPIPAQAISQPHWIESGSPGNVDERADNDRHLLIIDCTHNYLYELYNMYYDPAQSKWFGYSGAFYDMSTNNRRPEGWTSADAAGLAIFPGLVRYDEAANPAITDIGHAFRVTVRDTNGYVYPASHVAGSRSGALPMGARLRLKASVNGLDPALRTSDPTAQKIFRAMQKYGLIVADNGSDMYISGTFDVRWDNGILNPAFSTLTASDFEVIQLGWNPPPPNPAALSAVSASPNPVVGGNSSTGTVTLTASAPVGGALVTLSSASPSFSVPTNVNVAQGATNATFAITTTPVSTTNTGTLSASYNNVTKTTTVTVKPPLTLSIGDVSLSEGNSGTKLMTFTVSLSQASTANVTYNVSTPSSGSATAGSDYVTLPVTAQTIPAGQTSKTISVTIKGDSTIEANESFFVNVSGVVGATVADATAVGTIINDDLPSLSMADVSVSEGNSGTKALTFTVKLSAPAFTAVTYNLSTGTCSATAGTDYVAVPVTAQSIPAGQTSKTFAVTINGDVTVEGNETLCLNLSSATGATVSDGTAVGTIINDDGPTLAIGDVAVSEGNSGTKLATFTVTLSQVAGTAVSYSVSSADGTATAGSDYVALPLTAQSIPAGQTSKTVSVTLNGDATVEPTETFVVNLSGPSGATIADNQAIGYIVNDDGPTLSIGDVTISEGNSGTKLATFTVTLSQTVATAVTFNAATSNGTATAGSDYVALPVTAQSIPAGQTSKTISVTINGDATVEPNETFVVNLSSAVGASVLDGSGLGTITNDD
jgi:hypothetical protein